MRFFPACASFLMFCALSVFLVGCYGPLSQPERMESRLVSLVNPVAEVISPATLAKKAGEPEDSQFFASEALYMGDDDGYRYVHVREIHSYWGFLGECDYKVLAADWPMDHPMDFTQNASKWRNVQWLDADAPPGVAQSASLTRAPSFPLGAPATQPTTLPATSPTTAPGTRP